MKIATKLLACIILALSKSAYPYDDNVCFYMDDEYQGESTCLHPGQEVDLYLEYKKLFHSAYPSPIIDNDSVNSIKIPSGMMAKIYKNDNFNPPFFSLTESIRAKELGIIGMNNEISSIRVSKNNKLNCNQNCIILEAYEIKIPESFGKYWDDNRLVNKQILLVFDNKTSGDGDGYSINLMNGPSISINKKGIIFADYNIFNEFIFEYRDNADELAFIIQLNNNIVQFQYIKTLEKQLVDISPIISFKWQEPFGIEPKIIIGNHNSNGPLILNRSILTADTGEQHWEKRDLSETSKIICSFTPFLNIYNYITQGSCRQLDRIIFSAKEYFDSNTKEKTLHIAGDSLPLKAELSKEETSTEKNSDEPVENYMMLSYIDSTNHRQSLSLPAVAKTCMASIYSLMNPRLPRQIRPPCIDWTLEIMTDFTLLFGNDLRTWNSEYFSKVIDSIIKTGDTGAVVEDAEIEKRFSTAVKEKIADRSAGNALSDIKTAFDYAQLSYLSYSFYYSSDDMPAHVEQLPLGVYELLLETYVYKPTTPMVIEDGQLVAQSQSDFEIEIITTPTHEEAEKLSDAEIERNRALRAKLIEIIEQWGQQYQGTHIVDLDADPDMTVQLSKTLHAGHIVTGIIHRRLIIKRPGEIYVVVRFRGNIIAIVLADRFNNRNQVELVASATQPDYILTPNSEGTVRGAGTAAVNELARYLQQEGASTLFSEVISQPSARVKQKVGFTFKSEF